MEVKITRDGHLRKALVQLNNANKMKVSVGVHDDEGEIAKIAKVHEFGCKIKVTPKMRNYLHGQGLHLKPTTDYIVIPERSFIRAGFQENKKRFIKKSKTMFVKTLENRGNLEAVIGRLGNELAGDLQDYAVDLKEPANHPFTIAKKKSSNPLVDTGLMIEKITSRVE